MAGCETLHDCGGGDDWDLTVEYEGAEYDVCIDCYLNGRTPEGAEVV